MLHALLLWTALAGRADSTLLRILTTNDFHGALDPRRFSWSSGRLVGGAAALKATLDSAGAACRCAVLRLDGGDEMQGSLASNLLFGRSTIEIFNRFGLDAAVVGNHELDWGIDTLRARMREASWPFLAANVFDSATGRRPEWAVPWRMLSRGGLRVAVVGYMPSRTAAMVSAGNAAGLTWRSGRSAIQDALDASRAEHPDLTILLAHEGGFCDSLPCRGEIFDLAAELDSAQVQLIVAAHTHVLLNTVAHGIPVVQARSNGTAYGILDWIRKDDASRVWRTRVETVWADAVTPDTGVTAILARYAPMVERLARQPVAVLRDSLTRRGSQYPLGNLIADAQRAAFTGIDVAIMNNGGIRRDLPAGPVTYGDLYELQPFANNVTRVWLTGEQFRQAMEIGLASGKPSLHIAGVRVRYDSRKPAGQRVVSMRLLNGKSMVAGRTYVAGLTDFLQTGGEGLTLLRPLRNHRTGKTDLDALIAYLKRMRQPVVAPSDLRFIDVAP